MIFIYTELECQCIILKLSKPDTINLFAMASGNPSLPNFNVPIRIEPTDEYKIQEITYDGQEKSILPLSMSENLSQLIQRIDFNQPTEELKEELEKADVAGENEDGEPIRAPGPSILPGSSWPFESMRTKLRTALSEICVLVDVLAIAKEKKYMVFDTVNPKQTVDQSPIVAMMAKKRALSTASTILLDGAASLRASPSSGGPAIDLMLGIGGESLSQSSNSQATSTSEPNFYDEIREMRQHWRLKRQGNVIVGDLSDFRPIGHRFVGSSVFRVIKTNPSTRGPKNQALAVRVAPELEGRAYIQVSIIKSDEVSLCDLSTSASGRCYEAPKEGSWQEKLETAQNVLFCHELFSHLANQAVQYQFVIPATVTGNQIILALFPDVKLYITLVHMSPNTKATREPTEAMKQLSREHKQVFEHSLHQMFRDFYANMLRRMQGCDVPREAGPNAMDKQSLFELSRQESSLDRIVQQAQHLIMRQQTMEVIDSFAFNIKDPLIISHWFCLNSPTTSIVRVDIVSHNNEILGRSHILIYIGTRQLRVITRDCKNLMLSYEPDELRHLLVWQSCIHQFIASDKLTKLLGWYTMILNYNVNVTRYDLSSIAFSLVICSSNCSHSISIKSGPQFGLTVEVAKFKESPNSSPVNGVLASSGFSTGPTGTVGSSATGGASLLTNGCATNLGEREPYENSVESILNSALPNGPNSEGKLSKLQDLIDGYREVDWEMMQGRDFLTKLELLMAAFTSID